MTGFHKTNVTNDTMITFTIKILLAFSPKAKEKTKNKKKPEKKKPEKAKAKKKVVDAEVKDPPYLIKLEKTCSTAHIEYEILPGKCKQYQIDVLCWENAAKIYTADAVKIFKPVSRKGLTFVPICIEHFLKELSIEDLIALRNNVIEFHVCTDKNKLGSGAKSNKTEIIYIRETDVGRTDFVYGYTENVNESFSSKKSGLQAKSEITEDDISRIGSFQRNEARSRMKYEDNFADRFYEIIDYICDESIPRDHILFRDFIKACGPPEELKPQESRKKDKSKSEAKSTSKKSKKEGKGPKAEKGTSKLTIQMQGEIFFTDSNTVFKLENHKSEVGKVFVLPHVENLLTRLQKIELNPIIIKLLSIQNFPEEIFESTGITDVYCKYTIPYIAECKTLEKPIAKTIRFMDSHIYPTRTLSKIKLLEFLETKRLVVEIYGIQRYQHVEISPKMFGEKLEDANISKIHFGIKRTCLETEESLKSKNVFLAYCTYDLSSLLKNVWDFKGKEQLHTAESRIILGPSPALPENPTNDDYTCDFWSHYDFTMNTINLAGINFNTSHASPLREWILIQNNTNLGVEAYLLSPQSAALVLHQIPHTFKRLFMIAFKRELAIQHLGKIIAHNQRIICEKLNDMDVLTGFVIDNGNNFAIYVEGRSVGYILNLWQDLDSVTPIDAKIFFNTDQAYEKRLYNVCNRWSGFFIINMKIPLEYVFKNRKIYVKGNVPLLCQKALIKLNLMFLTNTMKQMFQNNLFPTIEELVSLDIEYGVPYAWKPSVPSIVSSISAETTQHV